MTTPTERKLSWLYEARMKYSFEVQVPRAQLIRPPIVQEVVGEHIAHVPIEGTCHYLFETREGAEKAVNVFWNWEPEIKELP